MTKNNKNTCPECRGPLKPLETWWHDEVYRLEEDGLYLCNVKYAKYECQKCGYETTEIEEIEKIRKADINEVIKD